MNQRKFILLSAYINYIFQGIGALILSLTLLNLKSAWHASTFQVSLVIGGIGLGRIIFMYPAGILSDKLGRAKVIISSSLLYALLFWLISFCPNYLWALICTLLVGLCHALYDTSIYPLITELYPDEKMQGALSILNKAFISLGQFLLPLIVVQIGHYNLSFRYAYYLCGVGTLLNAMWFMMLPVQKYLQGSLQVEDEQNQSQKLGLNGWLLLAVSFISVSTFTIFTTWVTTYGQEYLNLSQSQSSIYVSVYSVCSIISVFVTSAIVKLGVKKTTILSVGLLMTTISLTAINFLPTPMMLFVTTILIGFFAAGGLWQLGLMQFLETINQPKGKLTSYYSLAASLALFLIPSITGYFAEKNIALVFVIDNIVSLVGLLAVIVLIMRFYTNKSVAQSK